MAIAVKAHRSLHPGVNFETGCSVAGGFVAIVMAVSLVSVLVGSSISSDVLQRLRRPVAKDVRIAKKLDGTKSWSASCFGVAVRV